MTEFRRWMSTAEGIYQALTGRSPRSAERMTTQQKTQEMLKRYDGSTRRVAEILGVSQRTVQRRANGQQEAKNTSRANNADRLNNAHRSARVTSGRISKFKGSATAPAPGQDGIGGLKIHGVINVSQDTRPRWINPGYKIPEGELDRVIDTFHRDGPEAAAAELNTLISSYYVAGMSVIEMDEIRF